MHLLGVRSVEVVSIINGDSLPKVGLKGVHTHLQQITQVALVPFHCRWVGEVNEGVASFPHIPLPRIAIAAFNQVTFVTPFLEQPRLLTDVRIQPDANLDTAIMDLLDQPSWVREAVLVPFKASPFKALHPETVKVKNVQRNTAFGHSINHTQDRLFAVISGKRGRQPETKGPSRRQSRLTSQISIVN